MVTMENPTLGVLGDGEAAVPFVPPRVAAHRAEVLSRLGGAEFRHIGNSAAKAFDRRKIRSM